MIRPSAYRVEVQPADYSFFTPDEFRISGFRTSRCWALFDDPAVAGSEEVAVYQGWCWVQPKYSKGHDLSEFKPLYLGPRAIPEVA
ncbi:hypothetical protein [Pseudomonas syringae]|uniref:hypothetical protein n=1 Tax=Pseudomonas syringae TaxID=317 RepID=UPI000BB6568E|nr:hypothetical protein [Pseudomonas syringae]PBP32278.1 hypothetical protein CCL12_16490 [Pseudomonas syringae]PBP32349.1 hypothetical protein CCL12_16865 [Pseudomonas syringae]